MVPAGLEHVEEAGEVGLAVGLRVLDGVAHPGLGGQVDDAVEALAREKRVQPGTVGDVEPLEREARLRPQARQARFLQRRLVIGIEVVDAHDRVAARQQPLGDVHSDEAGGAGDQDFHAARTP